MSKPYVNIDWRKVRQLYREDMKGFSQLMETIQEYEWKGLKRAVRKGIRKTSTEDKE